MPTLSAKIRKEIGKKTKILRQKGFVPAVLYGPGIGNLNLEVDLKDFEKIYKETGQTSMIELSVGEKKFSVLIKEIQRDPISGRPIHIDFFQPSFKEKIEAKIPLIFEGEAQAVKELGGTFVKNLGEIEVKATIENLPSEIRVDISKLKTFQDVILVKDLKIPQGVKILRNPNDIVAFVARPEKLEELEKPIEEKIEEVEVIKRGKKTSEEEK